MGTCMSNGNTGLAHRQQAISWPSSCFNSHIFAQFDEVGGSHIWNTPCEVVRKGGGDKAVKFERKEGILIGIWICMFVSLSDIDLNISTRKFLVLIETRAHM